MLEDSQRAADVAGDAAADLIRAGRIETVEKWLDVCSDAADMSASATLARATLLYYAGRFAAARTLALAAETIALTTGRGNPHRALILAARAAFASGHPKEALQLYMRVSEHAELESDRVDALSGAVLAASDMEDSLAVTLAEELDGQAPRNRINRIRAFTQWAGVGDRMGSLENAERLLNSLEPLEDADVDPVVHSSAYNAMVHVLCGQARFLEALEAASHGRALCKRFRLPWAGDWIDLTSVRGFLGLGRFGEARSSLARLASAAASAEDASFRIVYERSRLQLALSEPRSEQNYVEHTVASGDASPAFVAELTAFRAIEAALGRQATDAKRLATDSAALPGAVEPVCYSKLALALAHDLPRGLSAPSPQLQDAVLDAVDRRLVEAYLVVARCHRPLVEWGQSQPLLADALTRARILPVANGAGIRPANGPMATLTPREAEVLELIAHGRTNAEIASTLVVSLSTAKTHVHRIFTKLDARNRAEATRTFLAYRDYASEAQAAETSTSTRSG